MALSIVSALTIGTAACGSDSQGRLDGKETVLYVALGASDALGVGAEPISDGYVHRIRDSLDRRIERVDLINLGIPGAEVGRIADAARLVPETGADPDLVTLWTGANDVIGGRAAEGFERELGELLARLRGDTDAFVVIANIPDLTMLPRFVATPQPTVTRERVRSFNEAIARQAQRHEMPVVDLFAQPVERELVSGADGFHPSNQGHARIAQLFLDVILPAVDRGEVASAGAGRPAGAHE